MLRGGLVLARGEVNIVSSLRLGTGLQVAIYDSPNADMTGTDIEGLYALGFGFERRLHDFSIGAQFQYVEGLKSGASTVGLGLQIGYGWSL